MQIEVNKSQKSILKDIVKIGGKADAAGFNGNTLNALSKRGLVKITENKKGKFVAVTAKAKKVLD